MNYVPFTHTTKLVLQGSNIGKRAENGPHFLGRGIVYGSTRIQLPTTENVFEALKLGYRVSLVLI